MPSPVPLQTAEGRPQLPAVVGLFLPEGDVLCRVVVVAKKHPVSPHPTHFWVLF